MEDSMMGLISRINHFVMERDWNQFHSVKNIVTSIYTFEILSSTEWNFSSNFKPNYFINLNRLQLLKKWKAIKIYKSEIRNKPHPRSLFGVETLAKYRGMQSGNLYAEGFELVRKLKK